MKKLLLLIFGLILSLPLAAQTVTIDDITYKIANDEATVSSSSSSITVANIPESITYNDQSYPVVAIGERAFSSKLSLTNLTIPNSVTSIGKDAFGGCSSLTKVEISDFAAWCKIEFENYPANPLYYAHHLYLNGEEIKDLIIPNSVISIGSYAFSGCSGLTSVTIPNSVTSIGNYAFYDCSGLTSVTIGNSVTSIGWSAFYGCSGLTKVEISDLAAWCRIKFELQRPSVTMYDPYSNPLYYANHLYLNGEEIKDLVIPNSITFIGSYAFVGCSGLTSVTIPDSVTYISSGAFGDCSGLTSVTIGNSVTSIGEYAFVGCNGLTSVTIPNSVTYIGYYAFLGCSGLTSVTIGNSVTNIWGGTFEGCNLCSYTTSSTQSTVSVNFDKLNIYFTDENGEYKPRTLSLEGTEQKKEIEIGKPTTIENLTYGEEYTTLLNGFYFTYLSDGNLKISTKDISISYSPGAEYADGFEYSYGLNIGDALITDLNLCLSYNHSDRYFELPDELGGVYWCQIAPQTSLKTYSTCISYKDIVRNKTKYTYSRNVTIPAVKWSNETGLATSTTSARLMAEVNLKNSYSTGGIEWRRNDAPANVPSTKTPCIIANGGLIGTLRGLRDDVYYQFRPYFETEDGETVYGEWMGFYTGDANVYFEPDLLTYQPKVAGNAVTFTGYALEGSDEILEQGFEYSRSNSPATRGAEAGWTRVKASGIYMSASVENLDGDYIVRSYAETKSGTYYGDEVSFSTNEESGLKEVIADGAEVEIKGYYNLSGVWSERPYEGFNIVVFSDGSTKKAIYRP